MKTTKTNATKNRRIPSAKRLAQAVRVMREYKRLMATATPADWKAFKTDFAAAMKATR